MNKATGARTAVLIFALLAVEASAGRWSWINAHKKEPKTVVTALLSDKDTFLLAAAAAKAGLVDDLSGSGPFTVFAPNNRAFIEAAKDLDTNIFALLFNPALPDILKYHVVIGEFQAADLKDGQILENLAGESLTVSIDEAGTVMIDGSTVICADKKAGNGVVHVIDEVILPSDDDEDEDLPATVVDIAVENSDSFSTLVAALGLETTQDLKNMLADPTMGPFTVFAPTDTAFEAAGVTDLNAPGLPDILKYHIVAGGKVLRSQLMDGETLTTLQGDELKVTIDGSDILLNGAIKIVQPDLEARNGIVHVIDGVLVPPVPIQDSE